MQPNCLKLLFTTAFSFFEAVHPPLGALMLCNSATILLAFALILILHLLWLLFFPNKTTWEHWFHIILTVMRALIPHHSHCCVFIPLPNELSSYKTSDHILSLFFNMVSSVEEPVHSIFVFQSLMSCWHLRRTTFN